MTTAVVKSLIENAPDAQESLQEAVIRLAAMSDLEYEQVRGKEADRYNVRMSVLDNQVINVRNRTAESNSNLQMFPVVDLWQEPVNGPALFTELLGVIKTFIICNHEISVAVVLWIVLTWVIDDVQVAPLAVITAPEKRCGKSQLLNLIGQLSRRPLIASNISSAAVYRVIEAHKPTLLIDEADSFLKENEELRGVINSGHTRQNAYVIRVEGERLEPKQFSTWGAKAISGIGALSETIMDRALVLELRRKLPNEKVERLRHAEAGLFKRLSSMLARWADDNGRIISAARPVLPETLNDRAQDNWEPLFAIADCASGNWPKLARDAALKISGSDARSSELLADIREIFQRRNSDRIASKDLLEELTKEEEAPWATYNRGKPMSPRQLAKRLGEYGIKPNSVRIGIMTPKGFMRADLEDVFIRYLPPCPTTLQKSATPQQSETSPHVTAIPSVADHTQRCGNNSPSATHSSLETRAYCTVADELPND